MKRRGTGAYPPRVSLFRNGYTFRKVRTRLNLAKYGLRRAIVGETEHSGRSDLTGNTPPPHWNPTIIPTRGGVTGGGGRPTPPKVKSASENKRANDFL